MNSCIRDNDKSIISDGLILGKGLCFNYLKCDIDYLSGTTCGTCDNPIYFCNGIPMSGNHLFSDYQPNVNFCTCINCCATDKSSDITNACGQSYTQYNATTPAAVFEAINNRAPVVSPDSLIISQEFDTESDYTASTASCRWVRIFSASNSAAVSGKRLSFTIASSYVILKPESYTFDIALGYTASDSNINVLNHTGNNNILAVRINTQNNSPKGFSIDILQKDTPYYSASHSNEYYHTPRRYFLGYKIFADNIDSTYGVFKASCWGFEALDDDYNPTDSEYTSTKTVTLSLDTLGMWTEGKFTQNCLYTTLDCRDVNQTSLYTCQCCALATGIACKCLTNLINGSIKVGNAKCADNLYSSACSCTMCADTVVDMKNVQDKMLCHTALNCCEVGFSNCSKFANCAWHSCCGTFAENLSTQDCYSVGEYLSYSEVCQSLNELKCISGIPRYSETETYSYGCVVTYGYSSYVYVSSEEYTGEWSASCWQSIDDLTSRVSRCGVHFVQGNSSDTAGTWTATDPTISSYFNGLMVAYKVAIAGSSSGVTLNINSLGAKKVYINKNSSFTTHAPVGSIMFLIYDEDQAGWKWVNYYDTNTTDNVCANGVISKSWTAANCSEKVFTMTGYKYKTNSVIRVINSYANTCAGALTVNINGQGAKSLYTLTNDNTWTITSSSNYTFTNGAKSLLYNGTNIYALDFDSGDYMSGLPLEIGYINSNQAGYAVKNTFIPNWKEESGATAKVYIAAANTCAGNIKLRINLGTAYPIWIDNAVSSSSNYTLTAGFYDITFDGANYQLGDSYSRTTSYAVTCGNSCNRLGSLDIPETGSGEIKRITAKNTATCAPTFNKSSTACDAHVIHLFWDNCGGYDSQLAVINSTVPSLSIRGAGCSNRGAWVHVLDCNNYCCWMDTTPTESSMNMLASCAGYNILKNCVVSYAGTLCSSSDSISAEDVISGNETLTSLFNADCNCAVCFASCATCATNVCTEPSTSNTTFYIPFISSATSTYQDLKYSPTSSKCLGFNPSTGVLCSACFCGTSSLAVEANNLNGTTVYSIPYQSASKTTSYLAPTTSGYLLQSGSTTAAPSWIDPSTLTVACSTCATCATCATTATTAITANNLCGVTAYAIPYQSASKTTSYLAPGASGYLMQSGSTSSAPSWISPSCLTVACASCATNATNATYLTGTTAGSIPYQSGSGVTSYTAAGTSGYLLCSTGTTTAPTWVAPSSLTVKCATNSTNATYSTHMSGTTAYSLPYQSASKTTSYLAPGTSGYVLQAKGSSAAPAWVAQSSLCVCCATSATSATYATNVGSSSAYLSYSTIKSATDFVSSGGSISGDVCISGNLYICGTSKCVITEVLNSCNNYINLRYGATTGLGDYEYSGIKIVNYDSDASKCANIVVDYCGCLRIGDDDDLQPLATRDEASSMTDGGIVIWDATCNKLETSAVSAYYINGLATGSTCVCCAVSATCATCATTATTATCATNLKTSVTYSLPYINCSGTLSYANFCGTGYIPVAVSSTSCIAFCNPSCLCVGTAGTATTANNLCGTTAYSLPYQSASKTTSYLAPGTAGYLLQTCSTTGAPSWVAPSSLTVACATCSTCATNSTNATYATYLTGTTTYSLPYQSASKVTSYLAPGTSGYLLQTCSTSGAPSWVAPSSLTVKCATSATSATCSCYANCLTGTTAYSLPYQSASKVTSYLAPGTSGYILQTNGTSAAPAWVAQSSIAAGTATTATCTTKAAGSATTNYVTFSASATGGAQDLTSTGFTYDASTCELATNCAKVNSITIGCITITYNSSTCSLDFTYNA